MAYLQRSKLVRGALLLLTLACVVFAGRAVFQAVKGPTLAPTHSDPESPPGRGWSGRRKLHPQGAETRRLHPPDRELFG
jgi:hypothetical protein